jgi:hypothetical protein
VDVFLGRGILEGTLGSLGCHGEAPLRVHGESSTRLRRLDIKQDGLPASVQIKLIQIEDGEFDAFGKDPREGVRAADGHLKLVRDLDYDPDLG